MQRKAYSIAEPETQFRALLLRFVPVSSADRYWLVCSIDLTAQGSASVGICMYASPASNPILHMIVFASSNALLSASVSRWLPCFSVREDSWQPFSPCVGNMDPGTRREPEGVSQSTGRLLTTDRDHMRRFSSPTSYYCAPGGWVEERGKRHSEEERVV